MEVWRSRWRLGEADAVVRRSRWRRGDDEANGEKRMEVGRSRWMWRRNIRELRRSRGSWRDRGRKRMKRK
jgi:hypothetical protein